MLAADVIEAVVGLAPNLFCGAGIPAALLICRKAKPKERRGKVLIVNGDATYQPGKAQNFLTDEHVKALTDAVHDRCAHTFMSAISIAATCCYWL